MPNEDEVPDVPCATESDQTEPGSVDPLLIEKFTLGSGGLHSAGSASAVCQSGKVLGRLHDAYSRV